MTVIKMVLYIIHIQMLTYVMKIGGLWKMFIENMCSHTYVFGHLKSPWNELLKYGRSKNRKI